MELRQAAPSSDGRTFDSLARYYDKCDLDRSAEIGFYGSLIGPRTRSLLELACGTGTIIAALRRQVVAQNGSIDRAVGLDASAGMLEIARDREPAIDWVMGDMRSPPLDGRFDLVICCYNGLQLMLDESDLDQLLASARRLTAPGGVFAFDLYQPNLAYLNAIHPEQVVRRFVDDRGVTVEVHERGGYDSASRILTSDWRFVDSSGAALATSRFWLKQYFAADIEKAVKTAGFVIRERFGDFQRAPFTPESKRQVVVCATDAGSA